MTENVNVLVVDDIAQNLIAMDALLSNSGLNILKASSGMEALELLLEHEVALALLDVNMPGMDGFEVAELMRSNARTRSIPIIFITAALHEPSRTFKGYSTGAVDFLNKPFAPEMLRSKVDVFVELYSQRKQLTLQLEELKRALHMNEMFTAVLGHDLRTPLSAVMTGAELITRVSEKPQVTSISKLIESSSKRMQHMVNQLLAAAKARSGDIKLTPSKSDYLQVCQSIIEEFIDPDSSPDISLDGAGDTTGLFDKGSVSQILSNLIGNALKHGEPGTSVKIRIDGLHRQRVLVQVHNAGHIPAERIADIFDPYQTAQQKNQHASGLGLGLYIVKQFVRAHGGEVNVRSTQAEGTLFEVSMPRGY